MLKYLHNFLYAVLVLNSFHIMGKWLPYSETISFRQKLFCLEVSFPVVPLISPPLYLHPCPHGNIQAYNVKCHRNFGIVVSSWKHIQISLSDLPYNKYHQRHRIFETLFFLLIDACFVLHNLESGTIFGTILGEWN